MSDNGLVRAVSDLDVTLSDQGALTGSMSGSQVHAVTRPDRTLAVLKVTVSAEGPTRRAAERELHFYVNLRAQVGVRTPELLDYRESAHLVAILLTEHPAPRPASTWSRDQWVALADGLARIHQTPVPAGGAHGRSPSWLEATLHDPDMARTRAFWSWPGEPQLLSPILADTVPLQDAMSPLADCFLHGDCHTDNILIDHDQLIWTDWQGAGMGNPAAELAFSSIRATPAGAVLPQEEMTQRYAEARTLDTAQVRRATLAAELATFLFTWPEYAAYNTLRGVERVHRRVAGLARAWARS